MSKTFRKAFIGLLAIAAFMAAASSAGATTVLNPGNFTGTASAGTTFVDTTQSLQPAVISTGSTIVDNVTSTGAGTISSAVFPGASNSLLGAFTVTESSTWTSRINLLPGGYSLSIIIPARGVTLRNAICTFTASGTVTSDLIALTGALQTINRIIFTRQPGLVVDSVTGCLGAIRVGDATTFSATYALSPAIGVRL